MPHIISKVLLVVLNCNLGWPTMMQALQADLLSMQAVCGYDMHTIFHTKCRSRVSNPRTCIIYTVYVTGSGFFSRKHPLFILNMITLQ